MTEFEIPVRVRPAVRAPEFHTRNEAEELVAFYKRRGAIKNCSHLRVAPLMKYDEYGNRMFGPKCEKESFRVVAAPGVGLGDRTLAYHGCPNDCLAYRAAWWGRPASTIANAGVTAFYWFDRQAPLVKAVALILVVAIIGAIFRVGESFYAGLRQLLNVIKEFKGLFG